MNIAILTGGLSAERGISLQSSELLKSHLNIERYTIYTILLNEDAWIDGSSGCAIDQNHFTLKLETGIVLFDYVFLMIHGHPAENGLIQGYFEMRNIPHSTCSTLTAALAFDKYKCKQFLKPLALEMANAYLVREGEPIDTTKLEASVHYPAFVKPNKNGSSYGVSKISNASELSAAVKKAFEFDTEVLVEDFIEGVEYSIGVVELNDGLHVLPPTEIRPTTEFFDYEAKYLGKSEEITPAPITNDLLEQLEDKARRIYSMLDCRGVVRIDFIRKKDVFYFLEINTIPGMSPMSMIPQQVLAKGWSISEFLDRWIDATITTPAIKA